MKHEVLLLLAFIALQPLPIIRGAQRRRHQRLRLAAREERRTVSTRQHAGLDRDCANLVECATIGTNPILRHLLAESPLAQKFVVGRQLLLRVGIVGRQLRGQFILDLLDQRIALGLGVRLGVQRILQPVADLGLQLVVVGFVESSGAVNARFGLPALATSSSMAATIFLISACANSIAPRMTSSVSSFAPDSIITMPSLCPTTMMFTVVSARSVVGRIDDELAIHAADAHRANRGAERNVGESQRSRGRIDARPRQDRFPCRQRTPAQ